MRITFLVLTIKRSVLGSRCNNVKKDSRGWNLGLTISFFLEAFKIKFCLLLCVSDIDPTSAVDTQLFVSCLNGQSSQSWTDDTFPFTSIYCCSHVLRFCESSLIIDVLSLFCLTLFGHWLSMRSCLVFGSFRSFHTHVPKFTPFCSS